MENLRAIRFAYEGTNSLLIQELDHAVAEGDKEGIASTSRIIKLNDSAYFVLLFAQFESLITDYAEEIDGPESKEEGFMSRVALIISTRHRFHSTVDEYYGLRCDLAHGRKLFFEGLHFAQIADNLEEIAVALQEASRSGGLPLG